MELRHYFAIIRQRMVLILLCLLAGAGGAYVSASTTAIYVAQSTLYVGVRQFDTFNAGLYANVQAAGIDRIVTTFAKMVDSREIAGRALVKTGAPRSVEGLLAATESKIELNTQLIRVVVRDPDPALAQLLANGLAEAFVEQIESFEAGATPQPGDVPQLPANVFEKAALPTVPQAADLSRRVMVGALFGFALAIGIALLLDYLDVTVKSQADAERRLELPILGVIPYQRELAATEPVGRANVPV